MSHATRAVAGLVICAASARSQTPRPPTRDTVPPSARAALEATDIQWKARRTRHAFVYALSGSAAEKGLAANAQRAERAIADNLTLLGVASSGAPLRIFLVGSRDQMRRFSGGTPGGWSITAEGTAFLVANDSVRPALRHETMHLLSWRHWGTPGEQWLSEGIATLAVGPCQGQSVEQMVAAARMAGMFAPLDTLRSGFVTAGELGVVHYAESASLVRYIERVYGKQRLRRFWSTGGVGGIMKSLGVDATMLERGWRASLAKSTPKSSWASLWTRIKARGCE